MLSIDLNPALVTVIPFVTQNRYRTAPRPTAPRPQVKLVQVYSTLAKSRRTVAEQLTPLSARGWGLGHSGVARRGAGGDRPPGRNSAPSCPPNEITLCTDYRGLWRAAILSPSQPPCSPLSPLAAPSFWKVWLSPCGPIGSSCSDQDVM